MIEKIIHFSVKNKFIIGLFVVVLIATGIYSMQKLPVDAVPDITNNQVQIVTSSTSLAPQEVEQFITFPIEMAMANIPGVVETRSISRFGLSVVTVIFEEDVPVMQARQFVKEQIDLAQAEIPKELGIPEMMPITTGLGEIYQYTLEVDSAYKDQYDVMELRTIQDWIVKRQLMGINGIIEVSSFGGYLKQYEVSVDPLKLQSHNVVISEVLEALEKNNQNSGGSYIEKSTNAYYIRTEGLIDSKLDIENIVVKKNENVPVLVRDIGEVKFGSPPRFGAMTKDGKGEAVGGITLMLKGANSSEAIENVHERIAEVQKSLPPGVRIVPYLDRSVLVGKAIGTVSKNLIEGGLIVIFVLILLLGNFRAGMIVASVIPLSLLFAFIMMHLFGVSANLMSLGAIDFGIVIDGAVIIVEGVLHIIYTKYLGKKLSQNQMDDVIVKSSSSIIGSAAFGVLIIIVVFIPIMTLTGIEGKMFTPMAKTVSFAILGALILSVTYVPMISALVLKKEIKEHKTFADRIMNGMRRAYQPVLQRVLNIPYLIVGASVALLISIGFLFNSLGAEFVPTLDEGDMAMQVTIEPGSSLTQMINTTTQAEKILKENFPEVTHVVSKIGTAEVPTDPMAVEDADVMILLKEKDEWVSASSRDELAVLMKQKLEDLSWAQFDFTQPIQLRFNELISGSKTDVAIKLFGEDLDELAIKGNEIAELVKGIRGAGDVKIEQTEGLPQLMVKYNREKLAYYQLDIIDLNRIIRTAYAGENAGIVYEGERRFDLTVRLDEEYRKNLELGKLFVTTPNGNLIPLSEVASMEVKEGPMQVSRENANRRIAVGINVRNRDIASFIEEVQQVLDKKITLKAGYFIQYGGQFENLVAAKKRLSIAVPVALLLIFILLFFAFKSFKYALLIYATVPLSAVGGVIALVARDMPFSISAGVGFIALFGVAVLNGIVLISYFNKLKAEGMNNLKQIVVQGSLVRLRPVIMTAAVASLGFLPMAISTSAGAEVQKPLATVVIGGLITATLLTLLVIPVIYYLSERKKFKPGKGVATLAILLFTAPLVNAQGLTQQMAIDSTLANNMALKNASLYVDQATLEKKVALSLGNTSVGYQYGQVNSSLRDYYWTVDQSLGNPMLQLNKSKEANASIGVYEAESLLIRRELIMKTKSAWHQWILADKQTDLLKEQLGVIDTLLIKLNKKKEIGDISKVDLGLAEIYKSELQSKLSEATIQLYDAESNLRVLGMLTGSLTVPESSDIRVDKGVVLIPDTLSSSPLLIAESAKIDLAKRAVITAKSNYFPELSLGYFNQSIDNSKGFQGLQIGVSIPLFNRENTMEVRKAKIQAQMQENNYESKKSANDVKLNNVLMKLQMYTALYQAYNTSWTEQSNLLSEAAELELETGGIDYYRYVLARSKVLEIRTKRLELINQLNQTYFELEYYISPVNQ
jgi:cobalt-zinc-cadmium resistance protein CzcA